jgi:PQQ-dependent catabolism-associated CXXCW motif protein
MISVRRKLFMVLLAILAPLAFAPGFGIRFAEAEDVSGPSPVGPPPSEPETYRTDIYRSPVPLTLKGATVLSSNDALKIWSEKRAIFIDVYPHPPKPAGLPQGTIWHEASHMTIENAVWLPNVGFGVLSPQFDDYFRRNLKTLTGGDQAKPLVFFCLRNCWMSWNAAKRALSYGYSNVLWYRDGTDGWQEIGGLVVSAHPLP